MGFLSLENIQKEVVVFLSHFKTRNAWKRVFSIQGFPCLENEREREESPYEVYLLVAATQKVFYNLSLNNLILFLFCIFN